MSGIPGMGQRWQAALKLRVIMIPLPENTAAGAASGVCCSVKGSCKVSGSFAGQSYIFRPTSGGEEMKNHARGCAVRMCSMASGMACGELLRGERKRKL